MKIALLAQAGSAHTRRWSLALAARGHHVRIISNSQINVAPPGIITDFLPGSSPAAYFLNIFRVRRILKSFAPDVAHAHFATGYGLWGVVQNAAPLIVTVWGSDVEDALRGRFLVAPVVRRALTQARFVTAPSRFLADRAILFEKSIASKTEVVPFGVQIPPAEEIAAGRKQDDLIRVIFAKPFLPTYAPEMVIEAFAGAYKLNQRLRLIMMGGGALKPKLIELARQLDIASVVQILGWTDPTEAVRLIGEADIMVMPSRHESFGVAAVEAAAWGVPVIATRVGGIPEIVRDGVNGVLIPAGDTAALTDALLRLGGNESLRKEMGEAGRTVAREKFDIEVCVTQMEKLYQATAG
jgi:L-malate glycosyltransferase